MQFQNNILTTTKYEMDLFTRQNVIIIINSISHPTLTFTLHTTSDTGIKHIYNLYGASSNFGLVIGPGPHQDTQNLQLPVFRWFNIHLKHEDPVIDMAEVNLFPPTELKVFHDGIPADQINSTIQNVFGKTASPPTIPATAAEWRRRQDAWRRGLREKVFAGWPTNQTLPGFKIVSTNREGELVCELESRPPLVFELVADHHANSVRLRFPEAAMPGIQERRSYMLLGQTVDGMRVWDIVQAIRELRSMPDYAHSQLTLAAENNMGVNVLYASLFEPVDRLDLRQIPSSHKDGPDYLNVLKILDIPEAAAMAASRCHVRLQSSSAAGWEFLSNMKKSPAAKLDLDFGRPQ